MKFVNKTGRDLTIYTSPTDTAGRFFPADGPAVKYAGFNPRGKRVEIDGIPVTCQPSDPGAPREDQIDGLPAPEPGTIYIVPLPVEQAGVALGRTDLVRMGPARFSAGVQTGAEGFQSSLADFPIA